MMNRSPETHDIVDKVGIHDMTDLKVVKARLGTSVYISRLRGL